MASSKPLLEEFQEKASINTKIWLFDMPSESIVGLSTHTPNQAPLLQMRQEVLAKVFKQPYLPEKTFFSKALLKLSLGVEHNECRTETSFTRTCEMSAFELFQSACVDTFKETMDRKVGVVTHLANPGQQGAIHIVE